MQAENIQYICLPDNIFQALNAGCFKEFFCDFFTQIVLAIFQKMVWPLES
jgi:hypothetical protein